MKLVISFYKINMFANQTNVATFCCQIIVHRKSSIHDFKHDDSVSIDGLNYFLNFYSN